MGSVIGKDRVDLVRDGLNQPTQEVCGVAPGDRLAEFDKGELRGPVDGDKEIELALGGSNLRDVAMEIADRIGLELPLGRGLAFDLGQPGDFRGAASSGATTSASDADGRLKRVQAVVQRQQRMPAEGDDHRFFLDAENR